jgi:hypothetical protein
MRPRDLARIRAGEPDPIVVSTKVEMSIMERNLMSRHREQPLIALALSPGLPPIDVRAIVGPAPRIFVVNDCSLLQLQRLPGPLALRGRCARIWWPGLTDESDPADHPIVVSLGSGENHAELAEFARIFDLSRPCVREKMTRIEGARMLAENQLDNALRELNDLDRARSRPAGISRVA